MATPSLGPLPQMNRPWWVHSVVQGLRHRLGLPVERVREELADILHISPKTLKGWEYRYCSRDNWRRFAEAVRIFLERAEAAKRETDLEEEVNP